MSAQKDYWIECISEAVEAVGLVATDSQIEEIAASVRGAHENYGMAFYSPPASDGYARQDREWKARYEALRQEFERYQAGAEKAVRTALRQRHDESVSIRSDGSVFRHGGRTEQIL